MQWLAQTCNPEFQTSHAFTQVLKHRGQPSPVTDVKLGASARLPARQAGDEDGDFDPAGEQPQAARRPAAATSAGSPAGDPGSQSSPTAPNTAGLAAAGGSAAPVLPRRPEQAAPNGILTAADIKRLSSEQLQNLVAAVAASHSQSPAAPVVTAGQQITSDAATLGGHSEEVQRNASPSSANGHVRQHQNPA